MNVDLVLICDVGGPHGGGVSVVNTRVCHKDFNVVWRAFMFRTHARMPAGSSDLGRDISRTLISRKGPGLEMQRF